MDTTQLFSSIYQQESLKYISIKGKGLAQKKIYLCIFHPKNLITHNTATVLEHPYIHTNWHSKKLFGF